MKKLFIAMGIFALCFGFTNVVKAEPPRFMTVLTFHKEGGTKNFWGQVRYKTVTKDITIVLDKLWNEPYIIKEIRVECIGGGSTKCSAVLSPAPIKSGTWTIEASRIFRIEEEMLDKIDVELLENGSTEGHLSQRVIIISLEGHELLFSFDAAWTNGDKEGNADIKFVITDITGQI
jgi:hypothetical protein